MKENMQGLLLYYRKKRIMDINIGIKHFCDPEIINIETLRFGVNSKLLSTSENRQEYLMELLGFTVFFARFAKQWPTDTA